MRNVEGLPQVLGGSLPAQIWHGFMAPAVRRLPPLESAEPTFADNREYPQGSQGNTSG